MRIGVLRGRENSFPDAFIAKVNSMGKGVAAEYVQLGGTKLNEPVPYRVILDRMSHEVPYYSVYLKMAALQGTYCINNTFWRTADDKFFGYAIAEKLGIAEPKTVVLPNRGYVDDVTAESLRNLWPTDFADVPRLRGLSLHHEAGVRRRLEERPQDPLARGARRSYYDGSGSQTMMLQEFITWDTYIRVPTIGRRWARAIRYDPAPGGLGGYNQDYDILPRDLRDKAEELSLTFNQALGYDMNAIEFAVKDGLFYGIDLTNYTPDMDYRSFKDAHFPWAVEKMAEFAVEKALSGEGTPLPAELPGADAAIDATLRTVSVLTARRARNARRTLAPSRPRPADGGPARPSRSCRTPRWLDRFPTPSSRTREPRAARTRRSRSARRRAGRRSQTRLRSGAPRRPPCPCHPSLRCSRRCASPIAATRRP